MDRRTFITGGVLFSAGGIILQALPLSISNYSYQTIEEDNLYGLFKEPDPVYYPFVRWWWNGNKIEAEELVRELKLMKKAGIGGVEINPIEFPSRDEGDDMGKVSLRWLSKEWIDMLELTFNEARQLGITCDLIVGSGWPFGSETLNPEERAQVILLNAIEIEGSGEYEISRFTIFKGVDPGVTVPYPGRTFELLSLKLVPDPVSNLDDAIDLDNKINDELIKINIPEGKFFLYALVRVKSFASVINGAPGAAGPILNHMDKEAVKKYLDNMSDTIQQHTGPLSQHLRALFTDSMELEGCNWTDDFPEMFRKKRGYDIMPWLPYIMFRVGRLGGVLDFSYGATKTADFEEQVNRVRFDFELTKAELLKERFTDTYLEWCSKLNVASRAQAYGRGFFPLETSLGYDIPEGESWTTNWLKHRVGEEMPDDDYRRGRAYTMINKYVSSAAHLAGKRIISCEEMTNTYRVFNTSLELLKIGSDQSIISGVTHSVWHGFNYSPPEAPYPGWIQYGSYYNENNNWWPFFRYLNEYKARISALLQNAEMYTDIAILPANYDLWTELGVQTDPFPEKLNVQYTSLIWEAINKNGGAADYITEIILENSRIEDGKIRYGTKRYGVLILAAVSGLNTEAMKKIYSFVSGGGKVLCIDKYPHKSLGLKDYKERDNEIQELVNILKRYPDRFKLVDKPDNKIPFIKLMDRIMREENLPRYLEISNPDQFLMQNRYCSDKGKEIIFFLNSHLEKSQETELRFSDDITKGKYAWIWDPETGRRFRLKPGKNEHYNLYLGPAESRIIVFDKNKKGKEWKALPWSGDNEYILNGPWDIEFVHCRNHKYEPVQFKELEDLKNISEYSTFSGTVIYNISLSLINKTLSYINLGKVSEISELFVNDHYAGLRWYGNHIYEIGNFLKKGENHLRIKVTTLMGNYMKSLEDNTNAQYWTNKGRKEQPLVSSGLIGPVRLYD